MAIDALVSCAHCGKTGAPAVRSPSRIGAVYEKCKLSQVIQLVVQTFNGIIILQ